MLNALPALQGSVQEKDLQVRVILHPLTYLTVGGLNHQLLKWDTKGTSDPLDDTPTGASPSVGDDLSRFVAGKNDPSALPENYLLFGAWKQIYDVRTKIYRLLQQSRYWDKGNNDPNDPVTGKPDPMLPTICWD